MPAVFAARLQSVAAWSPFEMNPHTSGSIVMREFPLPDARPPRCADGFTSASSHPELISGDLAISPRPHVPIMAFNRPVESDWRRAIGGLASLALIPVLILAVSFRSGTTLADGDA